MVGTVFGSCGSWLPLFCLVVFGWFATAAGAGIGVDVLFVTSGWLHAGTKGLNLNFITGRNKGLHHQASVEYLHLRRLWSSLYHLQLVSPARSGTVQVRKFKGTHVSVQTCNNIQEQPYTVGQNTCANLS